MKKVSIKVTLIPKRASPKIHPVEYVVETSNYDIAQKKARKQLILDGIDGGLFEKTALTGIWLLKGECDGKYNEEHF